ncbi:MAG: hypothetical protein ACI9R3_002071 [Verrucomicrobiales bacterium]|jgi:hypothetical protein
MGYRPVTLLEVGITRYVKFGTLIIQLLEPFENFTYFARISLFVTEYVFSFLSNGMNG